MRLPMARLSVVFVALAVLAHWGLTCVQRLPYPYEAFSALEVPTDSPYLTEPPSEMIYSTRFQRNDRLQAAQRLFEGKIQGSESVAVSPSGELIMLDKFGYVHRASRDPATGEHRLSTASPMYATPEPVQLLRQIPRACARALRRF